MFDDGRIMREPVDSLEDLLLLLVVIEFIENECDKDVTLFDFDVSEEEARYDEDYVEKDDSWDIDTLDPAQAAARKLKEQLVFYHKVIHLSFTPHKSVTHLLKDRGGFNITYKPAFGRVVLCSDDAMRHRGEGGRCDYDLFKNPDQHRKLKKDIKKKIISIYKKVKAYHEETVPIQKRQNFLDSISQKFPNAVIEAAFLRDQYEEQSESGNDRGISGERRDDNVSATNQSSSGSSDNKD